jgi:hypothetical protein
MESRVLVALALLALGAVVGNGCGSGGVDVDACKKIETARCQQAPMCGIPLEPPYSTDDGDVDACIRYYQTACLHGLAVGAPSAAALAACVTAIQTDTPAKDGCAIVKDPQSDPTDCGWLGAIDVTPEAGSNAADAADAADATDDAATD